MGVKTTEALKITIITALIYVFWIGSDSLLTSKFGDANFKGVHTLILSAPYLLGIFIVIWIDKIRSKTEFGNALAQYGIKPPKPFSILLAGVGILITFAGYFLISLKFPESFKWVVNWKLVATKFILEAGIAEELIFRGFLFRKLRSSRTFLKAATLSGLIFGLTHFVNFLNGFTMDIASSGLESSTFTRIRGARGTRIGGMRGTIL